MKIRIITPIYQDMKDSNIPFLLVGKDAHGSGIYEIDQEDLSILLNKMPIYVINEGWK